MFILKEFYNNAKVIISCNPYYYSPVEIIQQTINYIESAKDDFPEIELLGVFINHLSIKVNTGTKAFNKVSTQINDFVGDKMFKTIIRRDENSMFTLLKNNQQFSQRKTNLLTDYKKLVNEIKEKLTEA